MADDPELIDVRSDERLDLTRLEPYLRERLPEAHGPLDVRQFGGGHANLTYLLRFGGTEYVLRRPPLGPIAPSSHDMAREHRVLAPLSAVTSVNPGLAANAPPATTRRSSALPSTSWNAATAS